MTNPICSVPDCEKPSKQRGWCWKHYYRWYLNGSTDLLPIICERCGVQFPHPRTTGKTRYCRGCTREGLSAKRRAAERLCRFCDNPCPASKGSKPLLYCSPQCRYMFHNQHGIERPRFFGCSRCGTRVDLLERDERGHIRLQTQKLCDSCRRPSHYPLDHHRVAARDGFDCGICGNEVEFRLVSPHPLGPSVDHIIPWAKGGSNTADNLQLAHRICNVYKGVAI